MLLRKQSTEINEKDRVELFMRTQQQAVKEVPLVVLLGASKQRHVT